jgi:hypothetical protein
MLLKKCYRCKISKPYSEFYTHRSGKQKGQLLSYCKSCNTIKTREYSHRTGRKHPITTPGSPAYLGNLSERILYHYFNEVQRMPYSNPGYDFTCKMGFKIDAKSSCRRKDPRPGRKNSWNFGINKNKIADYFICLAFRDRESLEPEHIWLIPGKEINHLVSLSIADCESSLAKWTKYEKPLDKVVTCCDTLRMYATET